MFSELYESRRTIDRHEFAPLLLERVGFLNDLRQQELSMGTLRFIAEYLLIVSTQLKLVDQPDDKFNPERIADAAELWADQVHRSHTTKHMRSAKRSFICYASKWLAFMGRLEASFTPVFRYDEQIAEFAAFMLQDRGFAPATVDQRCVVARQFLSRLGGRNDALKIITISDVDAEIAQKVSDGKYKRVTVQTYASSLRAFFRFAEIRGWCASGISSAIMAPRAFHHETLPSGPSWKQVETLLASTEGSLPADIRDRAVLLLLSVYGLRAGEVAHLRLEDIDWGNEKLVVHRSKRLGTHYYPLSRSVGAAIVRYLKDVRPRSEHREVFLTLKAPFKPVTSATLYPVVAARLRPLAAGLRHCGPHALRHSCATHLLNEGHTLKEVGDQLGHRNTETTRIYAKVNLAGLREVARFDLGGLI
jgi:site-specific recombinase XerD